MIDRIWKIWRERTWDSRNSSSRTQAKLDDPLLFQNNKQDGGKNNFLAGVIRKVGNIR